MGGTSTSSTSQQSQTNPWAPAQGALTGILGQINNNLGNTGLNSAETGAINTITNNGASVGQYSPAVNAYTSGMLNGGGALNQAGAVNQNYQNYYNATNPLASNTNYDPMSTPGIGDQLAALKNNITSSVNGQFAAAGRDMSPANSSALAYGLASGLAPVLTGQYNQNIQNQQNAASNLYGAGNTTAGIQSGFQNQFNTNQGTGVNAIGQGQTALNSGAQNTLAAQTYGQQLPTQNLGLLANIGIPIAGLGSTSSGTSNTTNTASGLTQFQQLMSGLGGTNGLGGGTGLMGLLSLL